MKIQEIKDIISLINDKVNDNPEDAFEFFKVEWNKLTVYDKWLLNRCLETPDPVPVDIYDHIYRYKSQPPTTKEEREKSFIKDVCRSQISDYIVTELKQQPNFRQFLRCGENIRPVDIACVFKLLKDLKYLDNTLEEIEEVIAPLFNLNQNTIRSYLNEHGKLKKSAKQFKKLVDESYLVKA